MGKRAEACVSDFTLRVAFIGVIMSTKNDGDQEIPPEVKDSERICLCGGARGEEGGGIVGGGSGH